MLTKVKPYFKVLPNILIIFLHNHSNVRFYSARTHWNWSKV